MPAVRIDIQAGAAQTFGGFGVSEVNAAIEQLPQPAKAGVVKALWQDLGITHLRLWWHPNDPNRETEFVSNFISSNLTRNAQANGVQTLLLAPAGVPAVNIPQSMQITADWILTLKQKYGVQITVTGIANEPDGWNPTDVATGVITLRQALDSRGLTSVKIIAPEWSNQDDTGLRSVTNCKSNNSCWAALLGVAGHSYDMAATLEWQNAVSGTSKEYWMTEAGYTEGELSQVGVTMAGRFLNDVNHHVNVWVWFLGAEQHDPNNIQDYHRLIIIFSNGTFIMNPVYYYALQLMQTFSPGAKFRTATTANPMPSSDMVWTYGQKPAFNLAAAQNPDGKWGIGLSDSTGIDSNAITKYYAAQSFNVTIVVKELETIGSIVFATHKSNGRDLNNAVQGQVTMKSGAISIVVNANELVTLRQVL